MARSVVARLDGRSTNPDRIEVTCGGAIAYVYPQFIDRGVDVADPLMFKARVRRHAMGRLRVLADGKEVWSKSTNVLPERRIAWRAPERALKSARTIEVRMETS